MNFYKEDLLDHYQNPRNGKALARFTHRYCALNPMCGDKVEVFIEYKNGAIEKIGCVSSGCVLSTAAASKLSEHVIGLSQDQLSSLDHEFMAEFMAVQLGINRMQCILLPLQAIKKAFEIKS